MASLDFNDVLAGLGTNTVTITIVTQASHNTRGDDTETTTTAEVNCSIQILDGTEREVEEGLLQAGDAIGFFHPDDSAYLVTGNRLSYQSKNYVFKSGVVEDMGDSNNIFVECKLRRA